MSTKVQTITLGNILSFSVPHDEIPGMIVFKHPHYGALRGILQDGEPWFVAKDFAESLGYATPQKAVFDHCKRVEK